MAILTVFFRIFLLVTFSQISLKFGLLMTFRVQIMGLLFKLECLHLGAFLCSKDIRLAIFQYLCTGSASRVYSPIDVTRAKLVSN